MPPSYRWYVLHAENQRASATFGVKAVKRRGSAKSAGKNCKNEKIKILDFEFMTIPSLQEKYRKEVIPAMHKAFGYKSVMAVPRIAKVVVSSGVGRFLEAQDREFVRKTLALIAGQLPAPRTSRSAIAAFKTRQGQIIGYQATLRGRRMWDFLSRLVNAAIPRSRDFSGIPSAAFDPRGNLTLGFREHIVFPEIIGEEVKFIFGLGVTVVTTAKHREEGITLLKALGFPIKSVS